MIKNQTKGFTLIESLVVVGIFAIMSIITSQILFSTLKGSSKSEAETEVRQNGNYAISTLTQMIRNAQQTPVSLPSGVRIVNPDGGITNFTCESDSVASNSARITSNRVIVSDCDISLLAGSPPKVSVSFTVATNTASTRHEDIASASFANQITIRNYGQ